MKQIPKDLLDVVSRVMQNEEAPKEAPEVATEVVNKPTAEKPTANHGAAETGNEGDVTPPTQGSSNTEGFKIEPNAKVSHPAFGEGNVLATMGEGVEAVAEVMFKESLKRVAVWELEAPKDLEEEFDPDHKDHHWNHNHQEFGEHPGHDHALKNQKVVHKFKTPDGGHHEVAHSKMPNGKKVTLHTANYGSETSSGMTHVSDGHHDPKKIQHSETQSAKL
jgi:hypothetical protein